MGSRKVSQLMGILVTMSLTVRAQVDTVCYEPCGCFTNAPPFDTRPLPEGPWDQEITWQLYTRNNPEVSENITLDFNGSAIIVPPSFDPARSSQFVVHGYTDTGSGKLFGMKDVLLNNSDFNVFIVDWTVGADRAYIRSSSNTRVVGACSAAIATVLYEGQLDTVHCIGHSLGGQTCGYMGAATGGQLGRISGLDPASPLFEANDTDLILDPSDGQFVDVLHTNIYGVGLPQPTGHVDFYPNKGDFQPGCDPGDGGCSHDIVVPFYIESVRGPTESCRFAAYPCSSDEDADNCSCEACDPDVDCQVMGFEADLYPGRGTYFLRTVADAPYCEEPGTGPCA